MNIAIDFQDEQCTHYCALYMLHTSRTYFPYVNVSLFLN
jgi:hypothetical protein